MRRFVSALLLLALLAAAGAGAWGWWWLNQPVVPGPAPVELSIEKGTLPRAVARAVRDAGVEVDADLLYAWFRVSGRDREIKAGSYELEAGLSPRQILDKLARGEEALRTVTLVEGWTFRQFRAALAKAESLKAETAGLPDDAVMRLIGRPGVHPEGRFFPDTYAYSKGSSDVAVLRRAAAAMDRRLAAAWAQRAPEATLKTPDEALILASIVEKETGRESDRTLVATVFHNRLRIGMPLQTDPTVIYGLGEAFDGNLRKRDLQTDTPYNTYTRSGLPPTPIALPGLASLRAAVRPEATKALYFVARGDGSSVFSDNLADHNRAVNRYQRGQP